MNGFLLSLGSRRFALAALMFLAAWIVGTRPAAAQIFPPPSPAPSASASASPVASSTPRPGAVTLDAAAHLTFVSQNTNGFGRRGLPEAPAFIAGTSPAAPLTPYDTFSSAPMVPGDAGESALFLTPTYYGAFANVSVTLAAGYATGSKTDAAYWGESLIPPLNPHLGSQLLGYGIAFPLQPGVDDGSAFVASVLSGSIANKDGSLRLRGGWFDLTQSDSFVFVQPAYQSAIPSLAVLPAESAGNGSPTADWWPLDGGIYPLHGIDLTATHGLATAELTDAALPSLPGTGARLVQGSVVIDHGEGTRYSVDLSHVSTGGAPVPATVLFATAAPVLTSQGVLPIGTIGGQRETILGLRAAFHLGHLADGVLEYGHSMYAADGVADPGSGRPGNYYHAGLTKTIRRASASVDFYKNDPYYATAILPYGIAENVWSVAWSWPGQWLKSNYQLINNYPVNVDRQGYRVKYQLNGGPLELHASYANFGQIEPITISNARQTGFVDGFFLPQADAAPTLGRQNQYALWATWRAGVTDVTLGVCRT